ncbi:MAG: zf-TFIIB domain-containing protein [Bdellovibrionota bacterium]
MKCPACQNSLTQLQAGDVTVDVCKGGCGGVWFDDREIKNFDEEAEVLALPICNVERSPNPRLKLGAVRSCPRCGDDAVLCRRYFDVHGQVEVDQCLTCSGIWLDAGELDTIRKQYKTEDERNAAAESYLYAQLRDTEEKLELTTELRLANESPPVKMLRRFFHNHFFTPKS